MDKGATFCLNNIKKTLKLCEENSDLNHLYSKVRSEYGNIKGISKTGDFYSHYLKFENNKHKYNEQFQLLKKYNVLPNEELAQYLRDNFANELSNVTNIEDLKINKPYTNADIKNVFKCSYMGGMRRSKLTNSLVLISKHGALYDDNWSDDMLLYTGMGKTGDQKLNYSQNWTLYKSNENDIKVYLFESFVSNRYYYRGEVCLYKEPFESYEIDEKENLRRVWKFPLKLIDKNELLFTDEMDINVDIEKKEKQVQKIDTLRLKEHTRGKIQKAAKRKVLSTVSDRDPAVVETTKRRAKGICELCGNVAPFEKKNGDPYLETHHIITIAENGPDSMCNTVALCPNCHRKMHVIKSEKDIRQLSEIVRKYLLDEKDEILLAEFEKLFAKGKVVKE